MLRKRIAITWK